MCSPGIVLTCYGMEQLHRARARLGPVSPGRGGVPMSSAMVRLVRVRRGHRASGPGSGTVKQGIDAASVEQSSAPAWLCQASLWQWQASLSTAPVSTFVSSWRWRSREPRRQSPVLRCSTLRWHWSARYYYAL